MKTVTGYKNNYKIGNFKSLRALLTYFVDELSDTGLYDNLVYSYDDMIDKINNTTILPYSFIPLSNGDYFFNHMDTPARTRLLQSIDVSYEYVDNVNIDLNDFNDVVNDIDNDIDDDVDDMDDVDDGNDEHHILPKCLYPEFDFNNIPNCEWNKITLTRLQHHDFHKLYPIRKIKTLKYINWTGLLNDFCIDNNIDFDKSQFINDMNDYLKNKIDFYNKYQK
jgi:hypothetical protein